MIFIKSFLKNVAVSFSVPPPVDHNPFDLRSLYWLCSSSPPTGHESQRPTERTCHSVISLQVFGSRDTGTVGEWVFWLGPVSLKRSLTRESSLSQGDDIKLSLCWTQNTRSAYLPKWWCSTCVAVVHTCKGANYQHYAQWEFLFLHLWLNAAWNWYARRICQRHIQPPSALDQCTARETTWSTTQTQVTFHWIWPLFFGGPAMWRGSPSVHHAFQTPP